MEVVSESPRDRHRDLITKRHEYARAGVLEYWTVDPCEHKITVLSLEKDVFRLAGEFGPSELAQSILLPGFSVDAATVWALENRT
jgi:Uma2 family endonuclease